MTEILLLNKSWTPWFYLIFSGVSWHVGKRIHFSVGLFLFIALVSAVKGDLTAAFAILLIATFFAGLDTKHESFVLESIYGVWLLSTVVTLCQMGSVPYARFGISGNASMNGCLIALTLPIALRRRQTEPQALRGVFAICAMLAVFSTNASIPLGVLFLTAIVPAVLTNRFGRAFKYSPLVLLAGYAVNPTYFFNPSGRFESWAKIYQWWLDTGNIFTGLGTGMGTIIFGRQHVVDRSFAHMGVWAHNDYLQVLFDNGLIGLASALLVLGFAVHKSINRPWLCASVIGYGATAFFNFPTHVPIHAMVGGALLWVVHRGRVR